MECEAGHPQQLAATAGSELQAIARDHLRRAVLGPSAAVDHQVDARHGDSDGVVKIRRLMGQQHRDVGLRERANGVQDGRHWIAHQTPVRFHLCTKHADERHGNPVPLHNASGREKRLIIALEVCRQQRHPVALGRLLQPRVSKCEVTVTRYHGIDSHQ